MTGVGDSRTERSAPVPTAPEQPVSKPGGPDLSAPVPYPVAAAGRYDWPAQPYPVVEPDRITRFVNRMQARLPRWAAPLAALGCIGGAIGYTLWADPAHSAPDAIPSCILKLTTGLDCPGCGGTRAAWYLLHGDLAAASRHHLLFVFAVPFLVYLYVAWAGRLVFGWRLPRFEVTPKMIGVFLAVWMLFSVVRNLPWAPFTALYV